MTTPQPILDIDPDDTTKVVTFRNRTWPAGAQRDHEALPGEEITKRTNEEAKLVGKRTAKTLKQLHKAIDLMTKSGMPSERVSVDDGTLRDHM